MKKPLVFVAALVALGSLAPVEIARSQSPTQVQRTAGRSADRPNAVRAQSRPRQDARVRVQSTLRAGINANTVTVVSGTPGGTYYRAASDLAFVLDNDHLRVLPLLGKGAGQNAYDIRFLKGVDLGFVRMDTLEQLRGDQRVIDADRNIAYVARLFNDELHVIAGRDIADIQQLAGKRVSFDVEGSGTDYTGRSMFKGLGIDVQVVNVDQPTALDRLKRGDLAAVVSVAAKPVAVLSDFDGRDRFHLLPVPYVPALADRYFPATLTHQDYPKLLSGSTINTLAVGTVLAAYNWSEKSDRYKRIARFVDAFFSRFDELLVPSRHPKWKEVNLAAEVPGWTRFQAAQEWLDRDAGEPTATSALPSQREPSRETDRDHLWKEYLRWRSTQTQAQPNNR